MGQGEGILSGFPFLQGYTEFSLKFCSEYQNQPSSPAAGGPEAAGSGEGDTMR